MPEVVFNDHECTCDHPAEAHDDGPGCTVPGCDCLASWSFAEVAD